MRSIKSIIAPGALCMALLCAGAGLASACGNVLIYPLLFRAYSEAGRAYDAERVARRTGEVSAAVWTANTGETYHEWSLKRARKVLDRLAARLQRAAQPGHADFTVSIMLADEVYLAELHSTSGAVVLRPLRMGHPKRNIDLYTTANALRAVVNGRVPWQDAVKRDLIVVSAPGPQQDRLSNAFTRIALSD